MNKYKYIIALDQGTTSSRCIIFDKDSNIISSARKEFKQYYPKPGWVEHEANEILYSQISTMKEAMEKANLSYENIAAIGITNQRETVVIWDRNTGEPIYNAIVWQCRRTSDICADLIKNGYSDSIKQKTGLVIDSYFSLTKIKWILENVRHNNKELLFGTVDTWLLWKLTGGKVHATDFTNASRTMMYNINDFTWDEDILGEFNIPRNILPEVKPSSHIYGYTSDNIPIAGIAGDQQAALFGQMCFHEGEVKNTYGTGCFMLMNTGSTPVFSKNGLLTTLACGIDSKPVYALEGSVFIAGAVIQWLRDELMLLYSADESEVIAASVTDNNGVYIVPAFTGLGAPYWNSDARGIITGLTRGANRKHIVRAALESIAYQTYDVLNIMEKDSGIKLKDLSVDGGACVNNFLMQFQADIINIPVKRPVCIESTALGAAYLAGLAVGYYESESINKKTDTIFSPSMPDNIRKKYLNEWNSAVKKALTEKA